MEYSLPSTHCLLFLGERRCRAASSAFILCETPSVSRIPPAVHYMQDGAGEDGGITDASEFESEKENSKNFALWKVCGLERTRGFPCFWNAFPDGWTAFC